MNNDNSYSEDEIKELIIRSQNGDRAAMSCLYEKFKYRLMAKIREKVGGKLLSQVDSTDLSQSVWKDVINDITTFKYNGSGSFFNWLVTRSIHKIQTKGRYFAAEKRDLKKQKRIRGDDSTVSGVVSPPALDPSPSTRAMNKEKTEAFMRILNRFPEIPRKVLILRMKDELAYDEIGRIIDKSTDATKKLYARSLKKLIQLIGEDKRLSEDKDN